MVGSRTLIAEAMERAARFTDAIEWLQVCVLAEQSSLGLLAASRLVI